MHIQNLPKEIINEILILLDDKSYGRCFMTSKIFNVRNYNEKTKEDYMKKRNNYKHPEDIFTSKYCDIEVIKYFEDNFLQECSWQNIYHYFELLVKNGNLENIKYFSEQLVFSSESMKSNYFFRIVAQECAKGNFEIVKYFMESGKINEKEEDMSHIAETSCEGGNIEIVKYLHEKFKFYTEGSMYCAVFNDRNDVVDYLHEAVGIPIQEKITF
jgi:hypothetical protein